MFGIKVYTIGIGTMENTAFLEREAYGKEMPFYHQSETIEQRTLLEIAQETGGQYFNAQNLQTLEEVYTQIDALEQSELEERRYTKYNEYFHLCLWLALGLILLYVVAVNTRFQTIP